MTTGVGQVSDGRARFIAAFAVLVAVIGLVLMNVGDGAVLALGRLLALIGAPVAGLYLWRSFPSGKDPEQGSAAQPDRPGVVRQASTLSKPPKVTRAGQTAAERWWYRLSVAAALGAAMLLFWTWTLAMNESHCEDNPITGVPECDGKGPAARTLLGWTVLVASVIAVGLVMRRWERRRRLVRSGWNFVRAQGVRSDQGRLVLRLSVVLCWMAAGAMLLALWAPDAAGAGFALGGLVYAVLALVLLPIGRARVRP